MNKLIKSKQLNVSLLIIFLRLFCLQVWFQNRRSKERRMKQLSALGARRHALFRNPRRMRALRPGEIDEAEMMGQGFNYFGGEYNEYWSSPVIPSPDIVPPPFEADYLSNCNPSHYDNGYDHHSNGYNDFNYYPPVQ